RTRNARRKMKKRSLFREMMTGVAEMGTHRKGKITLRETEVEYRPRPRMSAAQIVALRKKMRMSQQVFARRIRTSPETLRNWEQSKSRPNAQAALLLKLVEQYPD